MPVPRFVGARVKRVEDPRLLRGQAQYVGDLHLPGLLHLVFVRSPHAHARVRGVETGTARELSGVVGVLTGPDVAHLAPKPIAIQPPGLRTPPHAPLAVNDVRYVGQPVAAVAAVHPYVARDAADLVQVDYDPLPAVVDPERALDPQAPLVHPALESNLAFEHGWTDGDVDGAFRRATRVIEGRFVHPRVAAMPLEPRGCVARYDGHLLTVWMSTQMPHHVRADLSAVFDVPQHRIRVIAPEVGGSFGCKTGLYDDEIVTVSAALRFGCPVKWIETRSENLVATAHGRGQVHEAALAVGADGRFLAVKVRGVADLGAYPETFSASPPLLAGRLITGAYRIPAASVVLRGVYTHRSPTAAYRGAGRPEAAYLIERLADLAAEEMGLDPAEIRRRNFIRPEEFPYRVPSGLTYDTGRYAFTLERALALARYDECRVMQAQARAEGRLVGVGLATFVETAGSAPSRTLPYAGWEYGGVRVDPSGHVVVVTGTSPHGQGQETTFAQLVADTLGIGLDDVTVLHGDTAVVPAGFGTGGSRGTCVGGAPVYLAAEAVKAKARRIAAHLLEAALEDVIFEDGRLHVQGTPARGMSFREVASEAHRGARLPPEIEPGLEATCTWDSPGFTVPFGAYVAIVEIVRETGEARVLRFIGVDDVGHVLSPLLLEGQLHGGITQGLAEALREEIVYDDAGQCLTTSLMDYAAPKAADVPDFELGFTVTPTAMNPMGAKGVGEAGTVGAPAAVMNAVFDALRPLAVRTLDMPAGPQKLWTAVRLAQVSSRRRGSERIP
ncbi:MAG TPA: xanthine dehydrogenase family protein molybdopterin-binding subunit [bacterium]|nr:xanthine dehydrogenase family protein molybdopterin-binding subunit [bacterium]